MPGRVYTLKAPAKEPHMPVMESCEPVPPLMPGRVYTMAAPVLSMPLPPPAPLPPPPPPKRKAASKPPPEPAQPGTRAWKIQQFISTHFQK